MQLLTTLTAIALTAVGVNAAVKNTTQEYRLRTDLKPGQPNRQRFDKQYIQAYHTGAGLDDATFATHPSEYVVGFLNGTNGKAGGVTYQNQVFDLNTTFAWSMQLIPNDVFYAAWQPVEINAGNGPSNPKGASGFWINGTGLQWTSDLTAAPDFPGNEFGGWMICEWWHGVPQLFFRINGYSDPAPCSCADVYLRPEYL